MGFLLYIDSMNVLVLSLKTAEVRRKYMQKVLSKVGINFKFIDSLSPEDLDDRLFENTPIFLSNEAVATFETHRMALNLVRESGEITLILEDDATPKYADTLERIDSLLKTEIDYDIMLLGYTEKERSGNILDEDFLKQDRFIGLHSYIVKPERVDKILNCLGAPNDHIDKVISVLISKDTICGIFSKRKIFTQNNTQFKTQIPKRKKL
jgi:GR25 family glycosyltransferase involved in LPS biosynthesis